MKSGKSEFSRGELAKATAVNSETIRYYESIKLMPDPVRSSAGHRIYDRSHLRRLSFIKRSRELGFTLKDLRGLLELFDSGDYSCAEMRDRTRVHIEDVSRKIRDLQRMREVLQTLVAKCDGRLAPECPIVETLFAD